MSKTTVRKTPAQRGRSNRRKGAEIEYEAMHTLERMGYIVMRSSGSHGPFDLCAIDDDHVRLIQVKASEDAVRPADILALQALCKKLAPCCSVELWVRHGPKSFTAKLLCRNGGQDARSS